MRFLRPILMLLVAGSVLFGSADLAMAQQQEQGAAAFDCDPGEDPVTCKSPKDVSVLEYVESGYQFFAIAGGLVAVLMLMWAGYRYMSSYGDPEKIADAKDIVEKTFIGLALLVLAALILNTVNPRTSQDTCEGQGPECGNVDFSKPEG